MSDDRVRDRLDHYLPTHADSGDYTWDDGDELADLMPWGDDDGALLVMERELQDARKRLAATPSYVEP